MKDKSRYFKTKAHLQNPKQPPKSSYIVSKSSKKTNKQINNSVNILFRSKDTTQHFLLLQRNSTHQSHQPALIFRKTGGK